MYSTNNMVANHPGRSLHSFVLFGAIIIAACIFFGALISRSPTLAFGVILVVTFFWLALDRPASAFVVVVVWMALPFIWTPSPAGHFLVPAEVGGVIFLITGIVRKRWFRFNAIDYILLLYVGTSVLSTVANGESPALIQNNMQALLVPYIGWRMLLASCPQARNLVIPCVLTVGTIVAACGLVEVLIGSNPFILDFRAFTQRRMLMASGVV
jgi:hypothetical protein